MIEIEFQMKLNDVILKEASAGDDGGKSLRERGVKRI